MRLKSRFTCTFTHTCCFYFRSTHPHTSTQFHLQIHRKLFYSYLGENSQKYFPIPVIPCEINAPDISELGVQRYPPERKRKRKYSASHSPQKALKCKKGIYPLKRAKSRIRLSPLLSPSSPYTIHSPHMHILI